MFKSTAFFAVMVAAVIALMSAVSASASPSEKSVRPADGSFQVAASWDRVCCKRGWQDWWSTRNNCRRAGGHVTNNRQCREDWNDRWDLRWWGWNGGNWDNRVCCKRGNRDWWSTARECRNSFGYITNNRQCRNDRWDNNNNDPWDNSWDNRWREWNSGWNVRICCKRGNRDWWTTARECRGAGGYRTYDRACRYD